MNTRSSRPRVALIAGPTASGKSALAIRVAEASGGMVVNADASQVYRDLRILSARPSVADEARAAHRLFGYRDGAVACSAADWAADARDAIVAAHREGRATVLVGGTGLYLRTLLDGIAPVPPIDPAVRAAVRAMPVAEAYARLGEEDAIAAARLEAADSLRVARALEVVRSTGKPIGAWQAMPRRGGIGAAIDLTATVLLPPRTALGPRISARVGAMLDGGAIAEVSALLARALPGDAPVMRAIGVSAIARLLAGDATRAETIATITQDTRRYAKRQATWLRHQTPNWLKQEYFGEEVSIDILLSNG